MTVPGPRRALLLHGAWHDGSCWATLGAELAERGWDVLAPDLPSDRPGIGAGELAACAVGALGPDRPGERVVVVGHSLGGLVAPVVAHMLGPARVAALVLVAALVPRPGASWRDRLRDEPGAMAAGFGAGQQRHDDGTTYWPAEAAASELYAGVAAEGPARPLAELTAALRRQDWQLTREVTPLPAWPDVATVQVHCADDRVVDPVWARGPGAVAGARVMELPGGHYPMLTRPAELAAVIEAAVDHDGVEDRAEISRGPR